MRLDTLAQYCDVSLNTAKRDVAAGRLPEPVIREVGRVRWDREQVDAYLDRLSGGNAMKDWSDLGA
jgi:predicted site-specific integrase-resolvase